MGTERTPLIDPVSGDNDHTFIEEPPELPEIDSDKPIDAKTFDLIIKEIRYAISKGIHPTRIAQGSSGSYFCRDRNGNILGVFKPKNEEPYGNLNPKWSKWLQRNCCPCCFGRGCLIPNSGYISEASASLVDQRLNLDVVPRTQLVSLASKSFHYSYIDRQKKILPLKVGSFQVFVKGYRDASLCLVDFQSKPLAPDLKNQFRRDFERLVILDYLIRNTDRGNDNWLIKIDSPKEKNADGEWEEVQKPILRIAAIDNGLAFPFKHPDDWRAYPFHWAFLSASQVPFSEETKQKFLPKLIDPDWCEGVIAELRKIAQADPDFNENQFGRQMAVFAGQVFNLTEALMKQFTPLELVNMKPMVIRQVDHSNGFRRRFLSFRASAPTFSNC